MRGPNLGKCGARGCENDAIAFDDYGEPLCEDCLFEQMCDEGEDWNGDGN